MKCSGAVIRGLCFVFSVIFLWACDSEKIQQTRFGIQQNLFLQSLELVEQGGRLLQGAAPRQSDIDTAMRQMDLGLQQAYQVERSFLEQLDSLLPTMYTDTFISGVEAYRIGVESSSREQQLEGLQLLDKWAHYWQQKKLPVLQKMVEITGSPVGIVPVQLAQ